MERELALTGGRTTTGVVRLGNTVRRPIGARAAFVHELLRHLEAHDFEGAPRFIEVDGAGREVLSFVPGYVPPELGDFSDSQLAAAARLLRQLHDATLECPLRDSWEIVCHGDASPCNCVFVDGMPTAFIDFDDAHAGSRLDDLGYAAWLWIDIGNDDRSVARQGQRVADFFRAYGLETDAAVPSIVAAQRALAARTESAGVRAWSDSCRGWVERHRGRLSAAIAASSSHTMPPVREDARG
jgi:Ser/Thr protein kinase RdoA (MazF antagonist)